jgi:hypothetical protein
VQIVEQGIDYDCIRLLAQKHFFSWSFMVLRINKWIALFEIIVAVLVKIQVWYQLTSQENLNLNNQDTVPSAQQ